MLPESSHDRRIKLPVSMIVFWFAVGLPLIYLPLFFTGLRTPAELMLFLGLFGVHVLTLRLGRNYRARSG